MSCHLIDQTVLNTSVSLTLGYLQAFAEADPRIVGHYNFLSQCRPLNGGIEAAWQEIRRSIDVGQPERQIFGFTNFFWNRNANLTLAQRIRRVLPEALIVFGGNDVTGQAQPLLADDSPVDVIVNGEGEMVFANLLAAHADGTSLRGVPGVSFRDAREGIITTAAQPRIEELDSIPSPFLSGTFSRQALAASLDIAYEFSRGCPFRCAFCYWGAAVGTKTRRFSRDRIREDLEFIISHAGPVARIWMADANFGMVDADVETAYILAELVQKHGKRIFLITNWAKNTTRRVVEAATVLYRHGIITGVTLSAQSLNDEVLKIGERKNIPFEYYRQLQDQFRALGIPTYTELIFGMPGESYASFLEGVERVISAGGTPVVHPLILLNNTQYNDPAMRRQFGIRSRFMRYMGHGVSDADILVGHHKLTYEDWLRGMGLRLVIPLFYCGLLKFVIRWLHGVHRIGYALILDRLVAYCAEGKVQSHPMFNAIFLHYMNAWDSSEGSDCGPIDSVLLKETQFGDAHYRALMRACLQDTDGARALVVELSALLLSLADKYDSDEFHDAVEYQVLLVKGMAQAAFRGGGEIQTNLTADHLAKLANGNIAQDQGSHRLVRIQPRYRSISADEFIFRILYGGIDASEIFAPFELALPAAVPAGC